MYIFLDESGDLGFSKKSSKWFLFTLIIIEDKRSLERVVKKVWKSLYKKHKHVGELHAFHEKEMTRKKMLRMLNEIKDVQVMTVVLNKEKVHISLREQKNILYNYVANILLEKIHKTPNFNNEQIIELVVDRKDTKKSLRKNFIEYLTASIKGRGVKDCKIELHSSHDNKSLQAVDFVSWAIFRKYEYADFEYYEIIKDKIFEEYVLFP